ncbi:MAG: helix-turn-helix transcriptional regulator [Stellaceae bacterium]
MEQNIFLTMAEVCKRYRFKHRQHVDRLVREGRFPRPIKVGARGIRFVNAELEHFDAARIAERDARTSTAVVAA